MESCANVLCDPFPEATPESKFIQTLALSVFRTGMPVHVRTAQNRVPSEGKQSLSRFAVPLLPGPLPGQWPQPGDGGRRFVEYGLSGARNEHAAWQWSRRR